MKKKILSMILVVLLLMNPVLPWIKTQAVLAENAWTLTIEDADFYNALKTCFTPASAIQNSNDTNQTITVVMENVTEISLELSKVKITDTNRESVKEVMKQLFTECTEVKSFRLKSSDLSDFSDADFAALNNRSTLTTLCLVGCKLDKVPNIQLPALTAMCLTSNPLSADDACESITADNFPKLHTLFMDNTKISDLSFLKDMNKLTNLSFRAKLTDDSLDTLLTMSSDLPELTNLNLGTSEHEDIFYSKASSSYVSSTNTITDVAKLALLPDYFPNLKKLNLSGLGITSLQDFVGIREDIEINFTVNMLTDFAGLETYNKFQLGQQKTSIFYKFAKGWGGEIPELLKRVLDEEDALYGKVTYDFCSLSEDGTMIVIDADASSGRPPSVRVTSGILYSTEFSFSLKKLPEPPEITEAIMAVEGDTLATLALPEGFAWKDSGLDVGTAGTHTFQADYTIEDEGHKYVKYGIDVPVTVAADGPEPTPTIEPTPTVVPTLTPTIEPTSTVVPTLTPTIEPTPTVVPTSTTAPTAVPTPTVKVPSPTPIVPTPTPKVPSPTPKAPSPTPKAPSPTPTPEAPGPASIAPTPSPNIPSLAPIVPTSTPEPDESKLTGNQIEKRKDLSLLLAVGKQKGSNGIRLTWSRKNGCSGYEVYWSYCDGKQNYKKLKTVKSNGKRECIHKNLKKSRAYKYYIATYAIKDGRKHYQSKSPAIHVAMKREEHTNAKRIKVKKAKVILKRKKTFQIKAVAVLENRKKQLLDHDRKFRYYVDNKTVASVDKKGKIKAKKRGSCTVFVIANNGVAKQIKVTVR